MTAAAGLAKLSRTLWVGTTELRNRSPNPTSGGSGLETSMPQTRVRSWRVYSTLQESRVLLPIEEEECGTVLPEEGEPVWPEEGKTVVGVETV